LRGADGAPGADGVRGADGAPGADGATGATGADGATGAPGATGANGATGAPGADGATGAPGATGANGATGADGATGANGATGPAGSTGPAGAAGPTGPQGLDGAEGPEGPEGPPGVVDAFYANVENDQGMVGSAISGTFGQTRLPATLTVTVEAGTYLLSWNAEVMRTTAGGGANFYTRFRDVTANSTLGFMRHGLGVENGTNGNIPDDPDFFSLGDLFPFTGSMVVMLPAGTRTYRLEYALSSSTSTQEALRAQHQRISLMRLE
jgi:hypothetical protein